MMVRISDWIFMKIALKIAKQMVRLRERVIALSEDFAPFEKRKRPHQQRKSWKGVSITKVLLSHVSYHRILLSLQGTVAVETCLCP
jgi:hypothetical protein